MIDLERERETCQTLRRRFLALALRVEVSLILFHTKPPESCFFTISITLVPQNAPTISPFPLLLLLLFSSLPFNYGPPSAAALMYFGTVSKRRRIM